MQNVTSSFSLLISLSLFACSSDDDSPSGSGGSSQTGVGSQQPGNGVAANGGSAGMASAGSSGSSSEGVGGTTPLAQGGGSNAGNGAAGTADMGASGSASMPGGDAGGGDDTSMSFFVTSRGTGNGGNFGGIDGADAFCAMLAGEVSAELGAKTWRAYLSTAGENARERIGNGPWRNAEGRVIANDLAQLHDQGVTGALNSTWPLGDSSVALDEQGNQVPNQPVLHDIITGTNADGTVSAVGTCSDWTAATGATVNGHSNRTGGGVRESWTTAHNTGCAEPTPGGNFEQGTVSQGGGRGSIYCFSPD